MVTADDLRRAPGEPARTLMVWGTTSDAGKSVMVSALCRILAQDGLRVRPFKAQNMSRNAFVTPEGLEIGTAQAAQAEAAGIPPTVDMNPILLKPEAGMKAQLVLRGVVQGAMRWGGYQERWQECHEAMRDSLARLRDGADVVVMEGAGSPAEVNLQARDLPNLHAAKLARAPALLVGDIDRGGVYAALVGSRALLPDEHRGRLRGFILNRFRGDASLLAPANERVEAETGVPVLGVVRMLEDLAIAEEDGLSAEAKRRPRAPMQAVEICVVGYPAMSNFDEFRALEREPGVVLRYSRSPRDVFGADLVILPGSKHTRHDLAWVHDTGFADALRRRARAGGRILGICGGCQILGRAVHDEAGVEGDAGVAEGLGLLPIETRFGEAKRTRQVRARALGGWAQAVPDAVPGYEIHHGVITRHGASRPALTIWRDADGPHDDGARSEDGAVVGTMVHGLFEAPAFRAAVLAGLRSARGLERPTEAAPSRDDEYDRLAAHVREALDMNALYRIIRDGV